MLGMRTRSKAYGASEELEPGVGAWTNKMAEVKSSEEVRAGRVSRAEQKREGFASHGSMGMVLNRIISHHKPSASPQAPFSTVDRRPRCSAPVVCPILNSDAPPRASTQTAIGLAAEGTKAGEG